jgi:hypothetical protein
LNVAEHAQDVLDEGYRTVTVEQARTNGTEELFGNGVGDRGPKERNVVRENRFDAVREVGSQIRGQEDLAVDGKRTH